MSVGAAHRSSPPGAMRAGLLAGGVFLLVFVVLSLLLLNLATPWVEGADTVSTAATRLLWLLVPMLVVDATAALLAAFLGARSALRRGSAGRPVVFVAVAPPLLVALVLAGGATDPTQVVYDLLAVAAGATAGALLALRGHAPLSSPGE